MSRSPSPAPHLVLATSTERRDPTASDALLAAELAARGARVEALPWDEIEPGAPGRLVCLRSTWDYHLRVEAFRGWLDGWRARPRALCNPLPTVLWNLDKGYLRELGTAGLRLPRTRWLEPGERPDSAAFLAAHGLEEAVVKPRVSATAFGTRRLRRGEGLAAAELAPLAAGCLLQEYVPEVATAGERSLVFLAGRFSHAVVKRAAAGDFRVQTDFGGRVEGCAATAEERAFAASALAAVPHPWSYARVDLVATGRGPVLMEVELIEPDLFLDRAPDAAALLAGELLRLAGAAAA